MNKIRSYWEKFSSSFSREGVRRKILVQADADRKSMAEKSIDFCIELFSKIINIEEFSIFDYFQN